MRNGPDIARIASLIGDPARANLLVALMGGRALTSSELAVEAGVTPQTIASHLGKLAEAGMIRDIRAGRHRYWEIAHQDVAAGIEGLIGLADRLGATRVRTGPKEPALRKARVCYDHLAGEYGVMLHASLIGRGHLAATPAGLAPTAEGARFFINFGIDLPALSTAKRPLCRDCLDWSERRSHLAGSLGAALLARLFALGWARREERSRAVVFTAPGERRYLDLFGGANPA